MALQRLCSRANQTKGGFPPREQGHSLTKQNDASVNTAWPCSWKCHQTRPAFQSPSWNIQPEQFALSCPIGGSVTGWPCSLCVYKCCVSFNILLNLFCPHVFISDPLSYRDHFIIMIMIIIFISWCLTSLLSLSCELDTDFGPRGGDVTNPCENGLAKRSISGAQRVCWLQISVRERSWRMKEGPRGWSVSHGILSEWASTYLRPAKTHLLLLPRCHFN